MDDTYFVDETNDSDTENYPYLLKSYSHFPNALAAETVGKLVALPRRITQVKATTTQAYPSP